MISSTTQPAAKRTALLYNDTGAQISIGSYRRTQLQKAGIPREYWASVVSPLGARFPFINIEGDTPITPVRELFNADKLNFIRACILYESLESGYCYYNSTVISERFNEIGVPVRSVEGYYYLPHKGGWCKHRFNELNGKYFDINELFPGKYSDSEYRGIRLFSGETLRAISWAFATLENRGRYLFSSTLEYNPLYSNPNDEYGDFFNEHCLNDYGVVCENHIPTII